MRTLAIATVMLLISVLSFAQQAIKKYVKKTAVPISAIDPDSTNFADLEAIGNAIGDASIVMLGEQDHGDAPAFLAKTRLIKYLHENKGFNVLAFESDFFALNEGWDKLSKDRKSLDSFLMHNIFPIWTACDACVDLFYKYIPATYAGNNPLIISGFDNQILMNYSGNNLLPALDSLLKKLDLPVTKLPEYRSEWLPALQPLFVGSLRSQSNDTANFIKRSSFLTSIKDQITQKLHKNDFWIMVIDNLLQLNLQTWYYKSNIDSTLIIRDAQMAQNLKWLSEYKFAGQKIIVWAANYHVGRFVQPGKSDPNTTVNSMGYFFTKDSSYQKRTYILGFTSYKGTAGRLFMNRNYTVAKPNRNGFENWIKKSVDYSFVDFNGYNKNQPENSQLFYLKGSGHRNAQQPWTKIYNGVFFIREMYPCKKMTFLTASSSSH